ncbi:unnamed protein product [Rhizophagus irregularis]|uniref:F-box domain-containing protein n=1 Tax=Rhizophagus irregularis TaxID=588596 RepID=A0A2I1GIY2_9GLOM|nr:hypothetical protein RhiirA4_543422 [Rhizophagus irregularis]CAB4444282.1 unnamed protein product [Rhizophagus irregularis]
MAKLNRDVLYLISKELQDNKKTLNSCLLVNKTWSEIFIPTLWKNPWKDLVRENEILLFDIIISHLSNDSRDNLIQYFNFLKNSYQKPLFDYISFCKHLNLIVIERIINTIIDKKYGIPIVESVILNLFIKENRKFTHLYIPHRFDHQIHLIPDAKYCFLELQFLCCHTTIDDNILNGLTEICKSIKELELFIGWSNNKYGIIKLIENQKELSDIRLNYYYSSNNESFFKILITSLIKFSNNIQYFTSKSLSLPFFQVFGAVEISAKSLTSLIENTSGNLIEIKIGDTAYNGFFNKRIIQAIYLNCPNLRYLKLFVENNNILEFEKLLINCKYLNGLFILFDNQKIFDNQDNSHNDLFNILIKSSPINLFKFKLWFTSNIKSDSLKLFFDNWKGKHPMLLQLSLRDYNDNYNLAGIYKAKGIIKRYDNEAYYEDFEWIKKKV